MPSLSVVSRQQAALQGFPILEAGEFACGVQLDHIWGKKPDMLQDRGLESVCTEEMRNSIFTQISGNDHLYTALKTEALIHQKILLDLSH